MRLRYLRGDVKSKTQTLKAITDFASETRFEQLVHRGFGNWFAGVRNPKFEGAAFDFRSNAHWLVGRSMGQRISDGLETS